MGWSVSESGLMSVGVVRTDQHVVHHYQPTLTTVI